ncbi:HAD family hydrolase [Youngiibacter multivorans]|uniref:HAD superfamily hydrolase (TIGR01509 family) n=1 Tax=Youngiibacter multivorans TaxID=937251 RepID=A0ABS4G4B1_9CLOT|nr:HAD family phosphatase [Youngiibacter multivorans]MBP1919375.1 HAD superfamily hydrolase (TIGR01509 family) [Youngiibacter multivorans]
MKIKGVILDLDGTIIDSMGMWKNLGEKFLVGLGIRPEEGLSLILAPMGIGEACEYLRKKYALPMNDKEIYEGILSLIEEGYTRTLQLKPYAAEFLERLRAMGVKAVAATATDRALAEAALKRLGVIDLFSGLITEREAGATKKEPEIFLRALNILGTSIEETAVFEDALHALRTAKKAGFITVAVEDEASHGELKEIIRVADVYIETLADWRF